MPLINYNVLSKSFRGISEKVFEDFNNEISIPNDFFKFDLSTIKEIENTPFYETVHEFCDGFNGEIVSKVDLSKNVTKYNKIPIIGVDGSYFIARPPDFVKTFVITNTAVIKYDFIDKAEHDIRVYTKVYEIADVSDIAMLESDATLYMLADEADGVAKYLSQNPKDKTIIVFDGLNYSALQHYFVRTWLKITEEQYENHPSKELYDKAIETIKNFGGIITTLSSQPSTRYLSPIVKYNACPYKTNKEQPMNCQVCKRRENGYNFDCEPYHISDFHFLNFIIGLKHETQDEFYTTYPFYANKLKKDAIMYWLHPRKRWFVKINFGIEYFQDLDIFETIRTEIALQLLTGNGYAYVLNLAHDACTINSKIREEILQLAGMYGLYKPSQKTIAKKTFSGSR